MKIFIPSYNRADIISTPRLINGLDYTVLLHTEDQRAGYEAAGIPPERIKITNAPVGMVSVRNYILENLVEDGEWFLMLDDNLTEIRGVQGELYDCEVLPVKEKPEYKKFYDQRLDPDKFMLRCVEMINRAEALGAYYCGFASTPNFFFRPRKWVEVGYVIGQATLIKKTEMRFDTNVKSMDDFEFTAANLKRYGRVLINAWVCPIKKHYQKGGIGTYEARLPLKIADCEYLMKQYPNLFAYKVKAGCHPKAELALRPKNLNAIEKWRFYMRGLPKV